MIKWLAGLAAIGMGLAVATAFSSSSHEVLATKGDRLDVRPAGSLECPKFEWPYGCDWNGAKSRRADKGSHASRSNASFRGRAATAAKIRRLAATRAARNQATAR